MGTNSFLQSSTSTAATDNTLFSYPSFLYFSMKWIVKSICLRIFILFIIFIIISRAYLGHGWANWRGEVIARLLESSAMSHHHHRTYLLPIQSTPCINKSPPPAYLYPEVCTYVELYLSPHLLSCESFVHIIYSFLSTSITNLRFCNSHSTKNYS